MHDRQDIEALKSALADPLDVCRRLGLDKGAQRQAGGVLVSCPAHGDRTPSCSVTRGRDRTVRVRCFGCPLAGDVFDLIAAVERLDGRDDFAEVLRRAAELARVQLEERPTAPAPPSEPMAPGPLPDEDFAALVAPLLHVGRLDDPELWECSGVAGDVTRYLYCRGLLTQARREGWGALPRPEFQGAWLRMLLDNFGEDTIRRSGLANRDLDAFAHPEARLVIPWRDPKGRVYTLQRRRLDDGKPKYVSPAGRPPRWPYGVHRLAAVDPACPVAFVEGAIDVLAIETLYLRRHVPILALGIQGVSGWRASWGALARERQAFVALDADKAGDQAIMIIGKDLVEQGAWPVERHAPARGKDWADLLVEVA